MTRFLWIGAAPAFLAAALGGLAIWPSPLFSYSIADGKFAIASDLPIPRPAGDRVLKNCRALVERSGLPLSRQEYNLFVTNTAWRYHLFFLAAPRAGGDVYYILSRNAFLSGADFDAGLLLKSGVAMQPPRTLVYYCAHELTHVLTGDHLGRYAYVRTPAWIQEGLADYVAIEPRVPFDELNRALGDRPVDLAMMQQFGVYPLRRLLVTYFLERRHWTAEQLLASKLPEEDAVLMMRAGL